MKITAYRKKSAKDPFIILTVLQAAGAAVILLSVFLAAKNDAGLFLKMRSQFGALMAPDYDVSGMIGEKLREATGVFAETETEKEETAAAAVCASAEKVSEEKTEEESDVPEETTEEDIPVMPVNGVVTSAYGPRIHPIYYTESFHSGRDIAADEGTEILAVMDGTVTAAGRGENSGNYIKLDHGNGLETLYCHCSGLFVSEGDEVKRGDVIAAVGHTGLATGPHLHFEVHKNGQLTDPAIILDVAENVD